MAASVMNPLIGKLTKLLGDEYKKLTGVSKHALFLRDELSAMKALLDKMELMDKLDPSAKNWRDHVREMSYDMENCIDDFMRDIEGTDAKAGFVRKMAKRLRRLARRHQIANRIEDLKVLAVEANARRERYKIDDCISLSPCVVVVDPRMTAIYKEATGLVGIDGPKEELVSRLMDSQKKLKVVSIVGFGGLGKTTLAKQVYDEIGGQFNCKAFVSVSQSPDVKSLLSGLPSKFGMEESSHACELQDIIDRLREYLKHKSSDKHCPELMEFLLRSGIHFASVDITNDKIKMRRTWGIEILDACHIDLQRIFKLEDDKTSMAKMAFALIDEEYADMKTKFHKDQHKLWEKTPLDAINIEYAAIDAYVAYEVYRKIRIVNYGQRHLVPPPVPHGSPAWGNSDPEDE